MHLSTFDKEIQKTAKKLLTAKKKADEIEETLGDQLRVFFKRKSLDKCWELLMDVPECMAKFDLISVIMEMKKEGRKRF